MLCELIKSFPGVLDTTGGSVFNSPTPNVVDKYCSLVILPVINYCKKKSIRFKGFSSVNG